MHNKIPNVFIEGKALYTKNAYPGMTHFDEKEKNGLRHWDYRRSKLGSGIMKHMSQAGFREGDVVLYLGSGHGFTPTFVSDIVGRKGMVFCLDFAPRVVRDLIFICEKRDNMAPILGNANQPDSYSNLVPKQVDVIFQDVAQKNQVEIFLKNIDKYLKKGGFAILALKARSVDVTKRPKDIFAQVLKELNKHVTVVDHRELAPFEKDHALFVCKK